MANSLNKVSLLGNVGNDPDIKSFNDGNQMASFSLATSERWKDKNSGEWQEKAEWHRITVFGKGLVGVVEIYVSKGSKLYIEGKLQTRKWQAQDGTDRYVTEVVLTGFGSQLIFLDSKKTNASGGQDQQFGHDNQSHGNASQELDDEVPF